MAFSVLTWAYPKLPAISGLTWTPGWPADFKKLPRGCFRLAGDDTGVVTTEGDGSANVSIYVDTWAKTPELREDYDSAVKDAMSQEGMSRGMTRHAEEQLITGITAYRSTILFLGEYDNDTGRMCRP
jgi:hypothetical protein